MNQETLNPIAPSWCCPSNAPAIEANRLDLYNPGMPSCCKEPPKVFRLSTRVSQVQRLRDYVMLQHGIWPGAVFSVDHWGKRKWLWATYGVTPRERRVEVKLPLVDRIGRSLMELRPKKGGRFFVHDDGAYIRDCCRYERFVEFTFTD